MTHGKGAARSRETLRRLSRGWAVPVWRAFASGYDSAGMSDVLVGPARPVRRRRPVAGLVTILVVLSLLGLLATRCIPHPVGAARTYGKYESKARTTAKSALCPPERTRPTKRPGGGSGAPGSPGGRRKGE